MSKLTNLFEDFRHYQWRKVDSPYYEPLGQTILTSEKSKEELKKQKHKEYQKSYYEKNRGKINEYNRNYWRKTHESSNPKDELSWLQKKVYDYLLNQYRKWEEPARWTQIAKALGISENSVYTAAFQLTKKWYLGRWTYGKYLLTKFPDGDTAVNEKPVEKESEMVYVEEDGYDKLVQQNTDLRNENIWLRKKIKELEEQVKWLEEQVNNSVGHIEWLMDSNNKLEVKNLTLSNDMEELKRVIKVLLKYFVSDVQQ